MLNGKAKGNGAVPCRYIGAGIHFVIGQKDFAYLPIRQPRNGADVG